VSLNESRTARDTHDVRRAGPREARGRGGGGLERRRETSVESLCANSRDGRSSSRRMARSRRTLRPSHSRCCGEVAGPFTPATHKRAVSPSAIYTGARTRASPAGPDLSLRGPTLRADRADENRKGKVRSRGGGGGGSGGGGSGGGGDGGRRRASERASERVSE